MLFDFLKYKDQCSVITDQGQQLTYSELNQFVEIFNEKLPTGGLFFSLCENTLGSFLGYVSLLQGEHVQVLLDSTKSIPQIQELMTDYQPNYIWLPTSKVPDFSLPVVFSMYDYSLCSYAKTQHQLFSNLRLLLTTSGSTGSPKLVRLSQENIASNAVSIASYLKLDNTERPITSLPMYYSFGVSVLNSHLLVGATILLTSKSITQKEFWTFLKENRATSLSGVPYTYEMLRRLRVFRMDLPSLKTFTQAGGKLNPILVKEFVENSIQNNKQFIVMYGQTEATARMSYLPFERALDKYSSIGVAIPGGQFSLRNDEGNEITTIDTDGELVYTGPNVSLGYAETFSDLSKGDENHGVLKTGDIARKDKDGFFYITGRKKRFLKVFGNRINLDALEQIFKSESLEIACVGVDDKVSIFYTSGSELERIKQITLEKTGINIRGFNFVYINQLPKNAAGKLQYAELQKLLD